MVTALFALALHKMAPVGCPYPRAQDGVGAEGNPIPTALKGKRWEGQTKPASILLGETPRFAVKWESKPTRRSEVFSLLGFSLKHTVLKMRQWKMDAAWTWNPASSGSLLSLPPINNVLLGLLFDQTEMGISLGMS